MLILNYVNKQDAICVPDCMVEDTLKLWLIEASDKELVRIVGQGLFIEYLRVLIKEKFIEKDTVQFQYNGDIIKHNKSGNLEKYPEGFCSIWDNALDRLLGW